MKRLTISGTGETKPDVTIREVLNKLRYYEDLEEQGRLIELPCKVGDTVYCIMGNIVYREAGEPPSYSYTIVKRKFKLSMTYMCGKTVFTTNEEAEKALKVMEN